MADEELGKDTFSLRYGQLEKLIIELLGADGNAVVSRFRKLRPKFAADGLLTETGNRVSYDLTRTLAILAIYQLNSLSIPQGQAVDSVVANWPEIARASLNARALNSPNVSRRHPQSTTVRIFIDAMGKGEKSPSWASIDLHQAVGHPHIVLDLRPLVRVISASVEAPGEVDLGLGIAFEELERTFGWEKMREEEAPRLPRRLASDFFGSGPFFDRARALLAFGPNDQLHSSEALRLQAYLSYVEDPAPIDSWKRFVGVSAGEPRLVHVLAAWGADLGLQPQSFGAETLKAASRSDRDYAMKLIQAGERIAAGLTATAHAS